MNQSTNQAVGANHQNNNGLQIVQNVGSPQNAAIVRQSPRPQNTFVERKERNM
ncbi:821_t:CDS:2 [Dentiscutata erythropus]|uniref:821_t:CDS:1 n=1 Tax=Dentiscutata erythropus TaxID=1348616 RepID=A0A9N9BJW1_9GLOM|nr:821_t:CDS:2 [Dentiscutata erythropus]